MIFPPFEQNPLASAVSFALTNVTSIVPEFSAGDGTPTFTRNLAAYATDFEGRLVSVPANAARMQGTRVVRNLLTFTEALDNAAWGKLSAGTGSAPVVTSGFTAPDGTATAWRLQINRGAGNSAGDYSILRSTVGTIGTRSVWAMSNTGASQTFSLSGSTASQFVTATASWQRVAGTTVAATALFDFASFGPNGTTNSVDILVWHPQGEDLTGATNQNPSEYVSVGVASAPYHGLGIDGLKCFNTLNGNTVASSVVTEATGAAINSSTSKWASLPGVAGSYFSTPDAAANRITGDIDIRAYVRMDDWTPAAETSIVSKTDGANQKSYLLTVESSGSVRFYYSTSGTGAYKGNSSNAPNTFANGTAHWIRATYAVAGTLHFYTSEDGSIWTELGTAPAITAGAIKDGTSEVEMGVGEAHSFGPLSGNIYRAQIYNGIGPTNVTPSGTGTLAVDFNPNDSTTAQTWTSATTGEVWTTNGAAKVFGNTHATYGIPAQWDASGPKGLLTEAAATNLVLQDATLTAAAGWADWNTPLIRTQGQTDPTGGSSATLLALSTDSVSVGLVRQVAFTGNANKAFGSFIKQGTSTTTSVRLENGAGSIYATLRATWSAGTPTLTISNGAGSVGKAVQYIGGWWWVDGIANSVVAADAYIVLNPSPLTGTTGLSSYFFLPASDNSTISSSPITTTTAAVTRPADVLTYPAPGNIASVMTVADSITPTTELGSSVVFHFGTYFDSSNYTAVLSDGTNLIARKRIAGTNHDATIAFTRTVGTTQKYAARFDSSGIQIALNGVLGTADATGTAAQIGSTFQIGGDGNGANQDYCTHRFEKASTRGLPDAVLVSMSS